MKRFRLWLLKQRALMLADQVMHGELLLRETRARLIDAHRRLRQMRIHIAELTPAADMLREMQAQRRQRIRAGRELPVGDAKPIVRL